MSDQVIVQLKIRRFDLAENPQVNFTQISLDQNTPYTLLKKKINDLLNLTEQDHHLKVVKTRNAKLILIPIMSILQKNNDSSSPYCGPYFIDVANINSPVTPTTNLLHDAYLDAVRQKLLSMESRIDKAELLVPEMKCNRQTHLDNTVSTLSSKVSFLNKRFDELMPPAWKSKLPEKIC